MNCSKKTKSGTIYLTEDQLAARLGVEVGELTPEQKAQLKRANYIIDASTFGNIEMELENEIEVAPTQAQDAVYVQYEAQIDGKIGLDNSYDMVTLGRFSLINNKSQTTGVTRNSKLLYEEAYMILDMNGWLYIGGCHYV